MAETTNLSPNSADFLPQFKAIGQSLKKRFFRKPNVADAVEQYESLSQELQREEQKEFAAICCLEAARCQESLLNHIPQANLLVKAGKLFLDSRNSLKYFESDCDTMHGRNSGSALAGNLQLGVQCLIQAAKVYKSQNNFGLCLLVTLQAGETLYAEQDYGEALKYFKAALDLSKSQFTLADQLVVVEHVIKCKAKMTEYESVSKIVSDYLIILGNNRENELPKELTRNAIQKFEIIRVCVILILGVNSADIVRFIWPESSQINSDEERIPPERKEVLFHLKSLVLAIQHGSVDEINTVRNHLAPLLNETQQDLFHVLIQMQS